MEILDKIDQPKSREFENTESQITINESFINENTLGITQTQEQQTVNSNRVRNNQNETSEADLTAKKIDNAKIKFRKQKQRLLNMCYKHEDIATGKEVTSTNKPRLLKLSIELQKQINNQMKDYGNIEAVMKQLLKILEQKRENDLYYKRQNDLHILRQSKCIPSLMEFCKKLPSLYRNEFRQCFRLIETINRILQIFCTLGVNRQYLILTNRIPTLSALLVLLIKRQQSNDPYIISNLYNIITGLLDHKLQGQYGCIIQETVQYLHQCSLVKRTICLFQTLVEEGSFTSQHLIKSGLRFLISVFQHTDNLLQLKAINESQQSQISSSCLLSIELILAFFNQYSLNGLPDKQSMQKSLLDGDLPINSISLMLLMVQAVYLCCKLNLEVTQKAINDHFLKMISFGLRYSKQFCEQSQDLKQLLNRVILLIGYLSYQNQGLQNRINQHHIISDLCNLPTKFVVDKRSIEVLVPTLCCLVYKNQNNVKSVFEDLSALYVKKFLKTQIVLSEQKVIGSTPGLLTRKSSLTSLNSVNTQCSSVYYQTNNGPSIYSLKIRFPQHCWKTLYDQLDPMQ